MALNKEFDPLSEVPGLKKMSPFVILAVVLVLLWIFSPFVIVGAGERGVVFNQLHGVEDKIYQDIGLEYEKRIIDPAVQEIVKAVTAKFTAEELITKRQFVKDEIKTALHERLTASHISLDELNITDFQFSKGFNEAIESKQTAEQLALKAQRDLERVKIEGQQKIVQAKAEAESQRIQKETISPIILQLRAIEKWDGKFPQVIGGSGALPFINIDAGSTRK